MANRERGEVAFESSGTTYTLVLNTAAMAKAQSRLNTRDEKNRIVVVPLEEIQRLVLSGSLEYTLTVFWAGLQKYHAAEFRHPDDASALCDRDDAGSIVRALLEAFGLSVPDPEDVKELRTENPQTAQVKAVKKIRGGDSTSTPRAPAA